MINRRILLAMASAVVLAGCAAVRGTDSADDTSPTLSESSSSVDESVVPSRFQIVPDDYHVPYAGTAEDGRRFFLSDELFDTIDAQDVGYVALFLWESDGTFSELRVDRVTKAKGLPPGQAGSAGAEDLVRRRLAQLGDYRLEPISVAPFTREVDGSTFGWKAGHYDDGTAFIGITPGDFIVYYAPWDGEDYDT